MSGFRYPKPAILRYAGLLVISIALSACGVSSTISVPSTNLPVQEKTINVETVAPALQSSPRAITELTPDEIAVPEVTQVIPNLTSALAATDPIVGPISIPNPAGFTWKQVVNGLDTPVDIGSPNDGSGRLFILEKVGVIRIVQNGMLLPEPFIDLTDRVVIGGNEMGLLGIAFHPNFKDNGYFYLNYTAIRGVGETHISRFRVSAEDSNRGDPGSEKLLLKVDQPYRNHNGGGLAFGPDGFLYIGLGDGGSADDPLGNGQSLETHLGKMLRIDVDSGDPYAIPGDNPFAGGSGKPEIWAYGLRNPWRFSFDRLTGDLWIADVGQNQWEEVNFVPAGTAGGINFGWDFREGTHVFEGEPPSDLALLDPVFEYQHGFGCSVTGGYVYRGQALPEFSGVYLVADFCNGRIWGGVPQSVGGWEWQSLFETGWNISSFGQDGDGELYLADMTNGIIYHLDRK